MAHTDSDIVVAQYIFDLIEANKGDLGIQAVYYGNQIMIPNASAAVVTAMGKRRDLAGVSAPGGRTMNTLNVNIAMHWSKVGSEDIERKAADDHATDLETLIHSDVTCGGIIIHGFITSVERGESALANDSMFRSVVMEFVGQTKTYLSPL